jgi:RimJ/RimL family protein N-acetyltransferase
VTKGPNLPDRTALVAEERADHAGHVERGVRIRHVAPADAPRLAALYRGLSAESRRSRFLGACSGLSARQAKRFACARTRGGDGFVATDGEGAVIGHLCLERVDRKGNGPVEELGIAVSDAWQRRGIGRALLDAAVASARRRGVRLIEAQIQAGNRGIHALLTRSGLPFRLRQLERGCQLIRLELTRASDRTAGVA